MSDSGNLLPDGTVCRLGQDLYAVYTEHGCDHEDTKRNPPELLVDGGFACLTIKNVKFLSSDDQTVAVVLWEFGKTSVDFLPLARVCGSQASALANARRLAEIMKDRRKTLDTAATDLSREIVPEPRPQAAQEPAGRGKDLSFHDLDLAVGQYRP